MEPCSAQFADRALDRGDVARPRAVLLILEPELVKEVVEGAKGRPDLGEAPVIIAGGRGLKAAENFKLVEALADAFGNAAVGVTYAKRPPGRRTRRTSRRTLARLGTSCRTNEDIATSNDPSG